MRTPCHCIRESPMQHSRWTAGWGPNSSVFFSLLSEDSCRGPCVEIATKTRVAVLQGVVQAAHN